MPVLDDRALPADARALLDKYNEALAEAQREVQERLSRQREELIQQLERIQDEETKAGHLDEAIAVREQVRLLQAGPGTPGLFTPAMQSGDIVPGGIVIEYQAGVKSPGVPGPA